MNAASLLDVKVLQNGLGGYAISISVFGKRRLSIESQVRKPDPTVSDALYGIAMAFKSLGDSIKELEAPPS